MTTTQQPIPHYLRPNEIQTQMNNKLAELIPEIGHNAFVQTPMAHNKWSDPSDTLDNGDPCFIAAEARHEKDIPNYIWMPKCKDLAAGYYHLRTQEAYIQINKLVRQQRIPFYKKLAPVQTPEQKMDMKIQRKVEKLMLLRIESEVPNDVQAERTRVLEKQCKGGKNLIVGKGSYLPTPTNIIMNMAALAYVKFGDTSVSNKKKKSDPWSGSSNKNKKWDSCPINI